MSSAGHAKRDRERAKAEKAALKRERKQAESAALVDAPAVVRSGVERPQEDILADLARLHARFDDGGLALEDFEIAKEDLIGQLNV
jgi:hypothetical protein